MTVSKTPNGKRWRARVKHGRTTVASKTFPTQREALRWHDAQKRALSTDEWVDPKAGALLLKDALSLWLEARSGTVAGSTLTADRENLRRLPNALLARPVNVVRAADLEAMYGTMLRTLARGTVTRTRDTLSAFYTWAAGQGMVGKHPVRESRVPRGTGTDDSAEIYPFSYRELLEVHADILERCADKHAAGIVLLLGLTGLRWGELAALRVRDVLQVPFPALSVSRSKPDGQAIRTVTKSGKPRVVPLVEAAWEVVSPRLDRDPNAPLFPDEKGGWRLLSNWKRATHWSQFGRGRRVHDLRHTAATHWLSSGIDLKTCQTWLGHSTAKLTADTYAHWMGSDADAAAVAKLNALHRGDSGGTNARKLGTAD